MKYNKHGYKTTEQHTYEIEVNDNNYSLVVDVTLFIKPPDSSTWDSDLDYYGYTELTNAEITECYILDENENEIKVEYSSLDADVKQEIERQLDQLIIEG